MPDWQFPGDYPYLLVMDKRTVTTSPSPEQAAKLERQRLAAEDGVKALQEVADRAKAIRENMARLRRLRLAREAQDVRAEIPAETRTAQARPKRRSR
jgi:hypothetical protein